MSDLDAMPGSDLTPVHAAGRDAELVALARSGDSRAFEELVGRYGRATRALAYALAGDWAEAEDLSQEAFLRAFRNLDLLADPEKFAPWLRRVTFGVCIDWVRTFRPQLYRLETPADELATLAAASDEPSPLEHVERVELTERVMRALAELPPRYRTPLTMYHIDGLSHEKVARALDVPVGTVRSLVARARRKLASVLHAYTSERPVRESSEEEVLLERPLVPRMLHVLNGDSTRGIMERSDIPGAYAVWADVLHEGPVPGDVDDDEFRRVRTRFLTALDDWVSAEEGQAMYRAWDERLASFADYDEVVLWFEHDLFDQLILIRHLDWFARRDYGRGGDYGRTRLSLICIGEFPGVEGFAGLGQLSPDQLASLLGTRQRVTVRETELARAAWRAFTSSDPTSIERVLERDTSALPFLASALVRFLEEYPAVDSGLPRTERQILDGLARGLTRPVDLFLDSQKLEERIFMGDATFWLRLERLASGPRPLVRLSGRPTGQAFPKGEIELTDDGRRVAAGEADWIALDGIDRWLGGVHLVGHEASWRWDPRARRLVRS
ncbi:MAG: sigma-70 family RNA polymerase sigma factor [Gemmatimonadota bacterium]|nr:sigma-70 family RNA polymerase sigma factor [Gemmatimonadota bacterium]